MLYIAVEGVWGREGAVWREGWGCVVRWEGGGGGGEGGSEGGGGGGGNY